MTNPQQEQKQKFDAMEDSDNRALNAQEEVKACCYKLNTFMFDAFGERLDRYRRNLLQDAKANYDSDKEEAMAAAGEVGDPEAGEVGDPETVHKRIRILAFEKKETEAVVGFTEYAQDAIETSGLSLTPEQVRTFNELRAQKAAATDAHNEAVNQYEKSIVEYSKSIAEGAGEQGTSGSGSNAAGGQGPSGSGSGNNEGGNASASSSIIDDYADTSTEMPSYTDPED